MFRDFCNYLRKQLAHSQNGNIIFQQSVNHQQIGSISLSDGKIVDVKFHCANQVAGLINIIIVFLDSNQAIPPIKYLFEPENTGHKHCMSFDFNSFLILANEVVSTWEQIVKFRPPTDLTLKISTTNGIDHDNSENVYKVLELISKFKTVEKIYIHSEIDHIELTKILIDLRKKKSVNVLPL